MVFRAAAAAAFQVLAFCGFFLQGERPVQTVGEAGKPVYKAIGGGYFHIPHDAMRARDIDNPWYAARSIDLKSVQRKLSGQNAII